MTSDALKGGQSSKKRNVFSGDAPRDFHCWSLTFQADAEDVPSCVRVAIVRRAAAGAFPASHSKICDTFRASDHTAVGTDLGSPSFVGLNIPGPQP